MIRDTLCHPVWASPRSPYGQYPTWKATVTGPALTPSQIPETDDPYIPLNEYFLCTVWNTLLTDYHLDRMGEKEL